MEKRKDDQTEDKRNKNTSPTDIKGKDVNEANQTNSGAGGSDIKEGSNAGTSKPLDPMGTEVMQEDGRTPVKDAEGNNLDETGKKKDKK